MQPNNDIKDELVEIKKQLDSRGGKDILESLISRESAETSKNLLEILKLVIKENIETRRTINDIKDRIEEVEDIILGNDDNQQALQSEVRKQVPLSDQDVKIIHFIQVHDEMACADDVRRAMNYKGRNAATARLKRLQALGLLDRIQLGHKVYYKYDAGKATNLLIVSPPQ